MNRKRKLIFLVSIGLNMVLIAFVAWGYVKMNFVKGQIFFTEVQSNLVELEGLIANQMKNNWSEPNLVTTELGDVRNGIWLGITTGDQLGTLSKSDKGILNDLYYKLGQYANDELYSFADVSEADKTNFEELRGILRDAGFGMKIQYSNNMKSFMNRAEDLRDKITISQLSKGEVTIGIPPLAIQSGDNAIPYVSRLTDASGKLHDDSEELEKNNFKLSTLPYIQFGDKIQLSLENSPPVSCTLFDDILNKDGTMKYTEQTTQEVSFQFENKIGTFVVAPHKAAIFSSNSHSYAPGQTIRGFRLQCQWEHKSIEYSFVVRTDAY